MGSAHAILVLACAVALLQEALAGECRVSATELLLVSLRAVDFWASPLQQRDHAISGPHRAAAAHRSNARRCRRRSPPTARRCCCRRFALKWATPPAPRASWALCRIGCGRRCRMPAAQLCSVFGAGRVHAVVRAQQQLQPWQPQACCAPPHP